MRRLVFCVALALASVRPLDAQTVLYATAASQHRVDAFRVAPDGSLSSEPIAQQATRGPRPRRLVARGCNLYVASSDRVEVFRIRGGGGLDRIGSTRRWPETRAHDFELYPETGQPTTLYLPVRRQGAIAAYPLDAEGRPSYRAEVLDDVPVGRPLSCVYGPNGADWEDIEVENGRLYAAFTSRVLVYDVVETPRCSNDLATACTTDADCRRCEAGHGAGLRCSNDITKTCTTADDCAGTCQSGLGDGLRCSNNPERTCIADVDCAPVCAAGQLAGAAPVPRDVDEDGTIEIDETVCPSYTTTVAAAAVACNDDADAKPRPRRPDQNCTFSSRGNLAGAVGLVVDGTTLVLGARYTHQLVGFTLEPGTGNFPPVTTNADPTTDPTRKEKKRERNCRKRNRTGESIRYIGLTLHREPDATEATIYAAGYVGRTDAFRLRPFVPKNDKCERFVPTGTPSLTNKPTSSTPKDVTSTPTRTAVANTAQGRPMLYVAAGELDRVQAFRLFAEGNIDASVDPMETGELTGSYPNDVVLVDVAACD